MNTTYIREPKTLAVPLAAIGQAQLNDIPVELAERVMRRVAGGEALNPRLTVAAFNSAL